MKIQNRFDGQLELTLKSETRPMRRRQFTRRSGRRAHAGWWFREMHRVVDGAMGWASPSPARPEQRNLTLLVGP